MSRARALRLAVPLATAIAGLSIGTAAAQDGIAEFYKGRTLTLVVGASPGGGLDLFGRMLARHIGRYIPAFQPRASRPCARRSWLP